MVAIGLQRGRDLGVHGYNDYREMCGLKTAKKFEDFLDVMSDEVVYTNLLLFLYSLDICYHRKLYYSL